MNEYKIVICHRGWIFVGITSRESTEVVVHRARCIRRWGTTKGLGELRNGPKSETVLDEAGTVRLHPLQIVATIDVDGSKWEKHLDVE